MKFQMKLLIALLLSLTTLSQAQFGQDFFNENGFFGVRPSVEGNSAFQQKLLTRIEALEARMSLMEKRLLGLQQNARSDWNRTENGNMYKLFPDRKNWDESEQYCQSLDAHLAVVDNQTKNAFIKELINEHPTADYVWIGLKTRATTTTSNGQFSNFAQDSPIDGCAVMDTSGIWSIRSCQQLRPFVCQLNARL